MKKYAPLAGSTGNRCSNLAILKKHFATGVVVAGLAGLLTISEASMAQPLPLWEVGAGVGVLTLPDYRGSDETATYVLPVPYFVYRGEHVQADRGSLRAKLFDSDRIDTSLSLHATVPVNSTNNQARRGMPDLKPTVELGGNVSFALWDSTDSRMKLDFHAPLRTAITVESSPNQIGWLFAPSLNLGITNPGGFSGWELSMLAGPLFNSRKYNAHFYSVRSSEALPDRPAYQARGGYAGAQFTMALSKRYRRHWVGGFLRYDSLAGAVFNDSPLVRDRHALSAGVGVSWIFGESSKLVERDDD
jgi:outer membrane protein